MVDIPKYFDRPALKNTRAGEVPNKKNEEKTGLSIPDYLSRPKLKDKQLKGYKRNPYNTMYITKKKDIAYGIFLSLFLSIAAGLFLIITVDIIIPLIFLIVYIFFIVLFFIKGRNYVANGMLIIPIIGIILAVIILFLSQML